MDEKSEHVKTETIKADDKANDERLEHEIRERAYALWEITGKLIGNELEHWLRAEQEIREAWTRAATGRPLIKGVPPQKTDANPPATKKTAASRHPRKVKAKAQTDGTSPKPRRRAPRRPAE